MDTRESHFLQDRQESVESSRIHGQKTKQHDLPGVINVFAGTLHHGGGFTFPMRVGFLLHMVDGCTCVWRERNTAMVPRNIQETVLFRGVSVMVWGCISFGCKMNFITIHGNLNGLRYQLDILERADVPHFDIHHLATRPIFMDDNARPHRTRAVTQFLHENAVETIPCPAMSPFLNPIEHPWDILGHHV